MSLFMLMVVVGIGMIAAFLIGFVGGSRFN